MLSLFIFHEQEAIQSAPFAPGNSPYGRAEWEQMLLRNPETGEVSVSRSQELAFARGLPYLETTMLGKNYPWKQRGPNNFGGRIRGFAMDRTDANILIAGSISGGIFRSTDQGKTWKQQSANNQNFGISCLSQDTRSGKEKTWYAGSGEFYNSPSQPGSRYIGNGILKSTDGGLSWKFLSKTQTNSPEKLDDWDRISRIVIDPTSSKEVVLASIIGGIMRSEDGGENWTRVLGEDGGADYTELVVTPSGKFYATLSSNGTTKGVFRSTDGINWAQIMPAGLGGQEYGRIVCAFDPTNENILYFLGHTPEEGKKIIVPWSATVNWISLWKYSYISGDGSGAGGIWEDHSLNLPSIYSVFDGINLQGGYCMALAVSPDDPNTLLVGGTNIHRSTSAFADSTHHTYIGGYDVAKNLGQVEFGYLNHHPDQHLLFYDPNNANVLYNANDGGVYRCDNPDAAVPEWVSLNDGLNTIQFYACAIDEKTNGSQELVGGTQDNGTFRNNTDDPLAWSHTLGADGGYCAIFNGGSSYVGSHQNGKMFKFELNPDGTNKRFQRIDPVGATQLFFINAWAKDPNDETILYLPADHKIWRMNGLDQISLDGDTGKLASNWTELPFTLGDYGTCVGVSTANPPNRLYVGSYFGNVYKVDDANTANPIYKATSFLPGAANGFVNCVAVDPLNGDHAMAIVSNYEVHSIFFTTDGGAKWYRAGGNLESEKAPDGANPILYNKGPAPSVRWGEILHVNNETVYLVGTSVGLFGTNYLAPGTNRETDSTKWVQLAPEEIGNSVVMMMKARQSDNFFAVATHGRGMYSTNINYTWGVTGLEAKVRLSPSIEVYPNPAHGRLTIRCAEQVNGVVFYTVSGRQVKKYDIHSKEIKLDLAELKAGIYLVQIQTENGIQVKKVVVN